MTHSPSLSTHGRGAALVLFMLVLCLASPAASETTTTTSKPMGSAAYHVELDDVRDRHIHWELFPAMAYFGRGITLGFAGSVDLRLLRWLQIEVHGQGAYKTFIQNPNGPWIADAVLILGGAESDTKPRSVELSRSGSYKDMGSYGVETIKTLNLRGVPLSQRTRSPIRLGARLYRGSADPAAPSGHKAADKRVDATILWGYLGFGMEMASNWRVHVDGYGKRSNRSQLQFGMDLMYAPIRDYAHEVSSARDDFLFPFGLRTITRFGSVAPLGFATKIEAGLSGAGAGWYAMIAFGVGGSALPFGEQ